MLITSRSFGRREPGEESLCKLLRSFVAEVETHTVACGFPHEPSSISSSISEASPAEQVADDRDCFHGAVISIQCTAFPVFFIDLARMRFTFGELCDLDRQRTSFMCPVFYFIWQDELLSGVNCKYPRTGSGILSSIRQRWRLTVIRRVRRCMKIFERMPANGSILAFRRHA